MMRSSRSDLSATLAALTEPGVLYTPPGEGADKTVQCLACAHRCRIADGKQGVCCLRSNRGGVLHVPAGYVSSVACDPIEKKPFYHFLPGRDALSFGMLGCNLRCRFCQNWTISQTLRDPGAVASPQPCTPDQLVELALKRGAPVIASTYNEPLVTTEWAVQIFKRARAEGLATSYISNGFASPEVLDYLDPYLDAMNVDLKCFTEEGYRSLGGRLEPVTDTIRELCQRGKWVEVITLVVPGFNDSDSELADIAGFLASVSPEIPWHVTAYHADYRMLDGVSRTPRERLDVAAEIGRSAGLQYVYGGNMPGLGRHENTYCHACSHTLIERYGFAVRKLNMSEGACPRCQARIPGVWSSGMARRA